MVRRMMNQTCRVEIVYGFLGHTMDARLVKPTFEYVDILERSYADGTLAVAPIQQLKGLKFCPTNFLLLLRYADWGRVWALM